MKKKTKTKKIRKRKEIEMKQLMLKWMPGRMEQNRTSCSSKLKQ
jgi:hypothetical protein